jgi:hypothetical protein
VAVNKQRTEDRIDDMLKTLQQNLARIKKLKGVYATDKISNHIAEIYRLGVEFSRDATNYYTQGMWKRLWQVISRPPSIALDDKVAEIKAAIKEMIREMDTLDRIRLNNVEKGVEGSHAQLPISRIH